MRPREWLASAVAAATVPVLAVLLGLVAGAAVMVISNSLSSGVTDIALPLRAYGSLLAGSVSGLDEIVRTVSEATPLILAGLSVGIGFKAGLFNIGANGQFLMGALGAAGVGATVAGASPWLAIPAALGAGMLAGAAYGFIPGALKAWTGAHEVVTTIMLNFIAAALIAFLVTGPLATPGASFARTGDVLNAELPVIIGRAGGSGHLGILFALAAVPLAYLLLFRSVLGFEIRTVGANPSAALYAGMRPGRLVILTMSLCGLLAGLAGATQVLGISHFISASYSTSVGFDAITVALLGRAHPVGILFSAVLFGVMRAGSALMQIRERVPVEIIDVIQAVILLFLAADIIVRTIFRIRAKRGAVVDELQTVTRTYGGAA
ncbi:MAG: ABC transporter permease [Chloroflexota bacterium]